MKNKVKDENQKHKITFKGMALVSVGIDFYNLRYFYILRFFGNISKKDRWLHRYGPFPLFAGKKSG